MDVRSFHTLTIYMTDPVLASSEDVRLRKFPALLLCESRNLLTQGEI